MPTTKIPVYLPAWLYPVARRVGRALVPTPKRRIPSLWGDRDVECSFIGGNLPPGPGTALDFGSGPGLLSLLAALSGYQVTALDLQSLEDQIPWRHPSVKFAVGDVLELKLPENHFDVVLNCSAIEHVGLAGKYTVTEQRDDGDLEAMARMRTAMKTDGRMFLTTPIGLDVVFAPDFRVYGEKRLPRLLSGFTVEKESYWKKDQADRWVPCERAEALSSPPSADLVQPFYSVFCLGCFVLRK
jgi:SAM-dependent methyltransferase